MRKIFGDDRVNTLDVRPERKQKNTTTDLHAKSEANRSPEMVKMIGPRIAAIDTRAVKPPPKRADNFYLTPEWRGLMDEIIAERGRRCEDPRCQSPDCTRKRIFGDHIVEIQDGGAKLDKKNVLLRCGSCHTRKTNEARAARHGL